MTIQFDEQGFALESGYLTVYITDQNDIYSHSEQQYISVGTGLSAQAYLEQPPVQDGFVAVRKDNGWALLSDHRGETVYSILDKSEITITEPGDYPANTTTIKPTCDLCEWDKRKKNWVVSEEKRTALLIQQREEVRSKINALRDLKNRSGVYVEALGKWFDNDDMAYQNLLGFKASLDLIGDYQTAWICADNSVISDFDKAKLTAVITQIMQDKTANVQNALRHKMALAHSDDPANYDYSDGWTRTYEDYVNEQK
ncbi:DUF4376 domain-containing protein [Caviibacterium pharyngocola]|uniref:DUF4376 domain-containing protein n=1 Tax=Caviibacterium pharyngocola TaxID=28159 RepID=A0A2M8RTB1_9PAST|nr:DUF4376 domain-containing protein [Caviibacterium pharyngocola]PJG82130.1 hypothetical protein CVP04_10770 [Caviibacterium pharyngocola]